AIELGAVAGGVGRVGWIGRDADRFEPFDAAVDDLLDAGDCLNVVNNSRLSKGPFDCGKRRLDARPGPLAFEAFYQARFFAADVGPRTAMHVDVERVAAAEDVL